MNEPLPNRPSNGKDRDLSSGRFLPGNRGGPGNPHAGDVGRHRAAFFDALRDDDVTAALRVIRDVMGDATARPADRLAAARELLDRVLGRPVQPVAADVRTHNAPDIRDSIMKKAQADPAFLDKLRSLAADVTT